MHNESARDQQEKQEKVQARWQTSAAAFLCTAPVAPHSVECARQRSSYSILQDSFEVCKKATAKQTVHMRVGSATHRTASPAQMLSAQQSCQLAARGLNMCPQQAGCVKPWPFCDAGCGKPWFLRSKEAANLSASPTCRQCRWSCTWAVPWHLRLLGFWQRTGRPSSPHCIPSQSDLVHPTSRVGGSTICFPPSTLVAGLGSTISKKTCMEARITQLDWSMCEPHSCGTSPLLLATHLCICRHRKRSCCHNNQSRVINQRRPWQCNLHTMQPHQKT